MFVWFFLSVNFKTLIQYGLKVTYMDTRIIFQKISYVHFLNISHVQKRKSYFFNVYSTLVFASTGSVTSLVHSIINARCFGVFSVEMSSEARSSQGGRDGLFGC